MAGEYKSRELVEKIHDYRKLLRNIRVNEYALAKAQRIDPDLEYVQDQIYDKFCKAVPTSELVQLKQKFTEITHSRDRNLETYVNDIVEYTRGLKGNKDLKEIHFIQTTARDKKTGTVTTHIVPVDMYHDRRDYHNEKDIEFIIANEFDKYVPQFIRPNKERAQKEDIEILSVSNITGLYDADKISKLKNKIKKKEDIVDYLEYRVESRIKTSERELRKFVDWLCGLRSLGDYPYDGIALRMIISDEKRQCGTSGEQLYQFVSYVNDKFKSNGQVLRQNTKTKEENEAITKAEEYKRRTKKGTIINNKEEENNDSKVKKLNKYEYDPKNFSEILFNMRKMYLSLEKKTDKDSKYKLTKYERETLKQYFQIKHYLKDGDRAEIQIMTQEMYKHFTGKFIGHTANYIKGRDDDCIAYRIDPSKSDAEKDAKKREERTKKNKNKGKVKLYVDDYTDLIDFTYEEEELEMTGLLHNILHLGETLEDMFRPVLVLEKRE